MVRRSTGQSPKSSSLDRLRLEVPAFLQKRLVGVRHYGANACRYRVLAQIGVELCARGDLSESAYSIGDLGVDE